MSYTATSCATIKFPTLPEGYLVSNTIVGKNWKYQSYDPDPWYMWCDGEHVRQTKTDYFNGILNGDSLESVPMYNHGAIYGGMIWTDGTNFYYTSGEHQLVLNGDTWEPKIWNGFTDFLYSEGMQPIWTDGTHIYYSYDGDQYVLNGDAWEPKTWGGFVGIRGCNVWTDGVNIYYSNDGDQYILHGNTWEIQTWYGLSRFNGRDVWADGTNVYYSSGSKQCILKDNTWEPKTWNINIPYGSAVWTDGVGLYVSCSGMQQAIILPTTAKLYSKFGDEWKEIGTVS